MELNIVGAWLVTVFLHLGLLVGLAWLLTRPMAAGVWRERLWRLALLGPLVTGSVQSALGNGPLVWHLSPAPVVELNGSRIQLLAEQQEPHAKRIGNAATAALPGEAAAAPEASESITRTDALVGAWLLSALTLLFRSHRQRRRVLTQLERDPLRDRPELIDRLASLQQARAGSRRIRLTSSPFLGSPIALSNNEICLPTRALTEFKLDELEAMLAHEVAHLRRRDPLWLRVYAALEAVFFFQPLVRLATSALRTEAEIACDAWAVKRGASPIGLARCLAQVARWLPLAPVSLSAMAGGESDLVQRVERLTVPQASGASGRAAVLGVATLALALGALACFGPAASTDAPVSDAAEGAQVKLHLALNGELRANGIRFNPPQDWSLFEEWLNDHAALEDSTDPGSLSDVRVEIQVDEGVPFREVLLVMGQLAKARIWDIEYALAGGERLAVPIPRDLEQIEQETPEAAEPLEFIDQELQDELAGLGYLAVEEGESSVKVKIKLSVVQSAPRRVEYELNANRIRSLETLTKRVAALPGSLGQASFVIHANSGIVYGDVIALLDTLMGLGVSGSQFVFVGAYDHR